MKTICLVLIVAAVMLAGCQEKQSNGSGVWNPELETTPEFKALFSDSNTDRLNFAQNGVINNHEAILGGVNVTGEDGKVVHRRGVLERLAQIETQLEEFGKQNAEQHKLMGETDIRLTERLSDIAEPE